MLEFGAREKGLRWQSAAFMFLYCLYASGPMPLQCGFGMRRSMGNDSDGSCCVKKTLGSEVLRFYL